MALTIDNDLSTPKSTGAFPTPGPISTGEPETVAKQRADLGLSDDPTGMSDSSWKPETKVIGAPDPVVPAEPATQAETPSAPPAAPKPSPAPAS
jgi:hypothetical protein